MQFFVEIAVSFYNYNVNEVSFKMIRFWLLTTY